MIHTGFITYAPLHVNSFEIRIVLIVQEYNIAFYKQIWAANNNYRDYIWNIPQFEISFFFLHDIFIRFI